MATFRAIGGKCRALMAAASAAAKSSAVAATSSSSSKPSPAVKRVKRTPSPANAGKGILKPLPISPALSGFIGAPEVSRADAVKKVWDYIKLHNLQNPTNKREIICDEKLKALFDGKDKVGFLQIASLLAQHFVKTG